jgi:hypothetical protein
MRFRGLVPAIIEPAVTGYLESAPFTFDRVKTPDVFAYTLLADFI